MYTKDNICQDSFLDELIKNNVTVNVFLENGTKLVGKILHYDKHCIKMTNRADGTQIVYKTRITTVSEE